MKVYELMSELSKVNAGEEININICLTQSELQHGEQIDDGLYTLNLEIGDIDLIDATISTRL